jgi:hypothetical protein
MRAPGRTWSKGWAIGAWFIPIANFVVPYLVLGEASKVLQASAEGQAAKWRIRRYPVALMLWAIGSLGMGLAAWIAPPEKVERESLFIDAYPDSYLAYSSMLFLVLWVVAAVVFMRNSQQDIERT